MHFSCLTAGMLLARLARPEVTNCIAGLKQYRYAYEEAGEEAVEMERLYSAAINNESDLNHMASVVHSGPQQTQTQLNSSTQHQQQNVDMAIDPPYVGAGAGGHENHNVCDLPCEALLCY